MTLRLPNPPASILLVKTSSMGDVVHLLPAITDIAGYFPHTAIDWLVEESFADLPRLHPALNRVIPVALRRWRSAPLSGSTRSEFRAFRNALKWHTYDFVIDAQGLVKSAFLAAFAKGEHTGPGFGNAREPLAALLYRRRLPVPWTLPAITANRRLVTAALYLPDRSASPPDYGLQTQPLMAAWLPAAPYAVLLHGASAAAKLWPEQNWQTLGRFLEQRGLHCVIPWGSAEEFLRAGRLAHEIPGAVLAPELSLAQAAALLAGAKLAVGVDSGLAHLGAALGIPVIAIFCASDPARTGVVAMQGRVAVNLGSEGKPPAAEQVIASVTQALA
jgi:heptosyltransferase-1